MKSAIVRWRESGGTEKSEQWSGSLTFSSASSVISAENETGTPGE